MVELTRIYTRTGDAGQTRLSDMSLTDKADPRVAAYGDVDEANSAIGVALATGGLPPEVAVLLQHIQHGTSGKLGNNGQRPDSQRKSRQKQIT